MSDTLGADWGVQKKSPMPRTPALLAALASLVFNASASATEFTGELQWVSGGLAPPTYGCPHGSLDCAASADYEYLTPGEARGSFFSVADDETLIHPQLYFPYLPPALVPVGGVSEDAILFSSMVYAGDVPVTRSGNTFIQSAPSLITVVGGENSFTGSFVTYVAEVRDLTCILGVPVQTCRATFAFSDVAGHDWVHTFDVSVVPEPGPVINAAFTAAVFLLWVLRFRSRGAAGRSVQSLPEKSTHIP